MTKFKKITVSSLYYGFPVALLSTYDPASEETNITPVSSAWSLGQEMVIGIGLGGKCIQNLAQEKLFIASLPTPEIWESVERIADTTGHSDMPDWKKQMGYRHCANKFAEAGFTPVSYKKFKAAAISECPIHVLLSVSNISLRSSFAIVEAHIEQIYVHESLESNGRINELKWHPLLYKFRQYSSVGEHLGNNFRYRPSLS